MKKILILITALLITFSLSGCGDIRSDSDDDIKTCEENGGTYNKYIAPLGCNYDNEYYTQEEVDEIIEDEFKKFKNLLEEYMVWYEEENGNLYTQCQEASGWEECFVELDYVTQIELNNELMYYQLKLEELESALETWTQDVEDRLDSLELVRSYTQDEIYIIITLYDMEQSKYLIEQLAIEEDRELTSEEELKIIGYEVLITQLINELEETE